MPPNQPQADIATLLRRRQHIQHAAGLVAAQPLAFGHNHRPAAVGQSRFQQAQALRERQRLAASEGLPQLAAAFQRHAGRQR